MMEFSLSLSLSLSHCKILSKKWLYLYYNDVIFFTNVFEKKNWQLTVCVCVHKKRKKERKISPLPAFTSLLHWIPSSSSSSSKFSFIHSFWLFWSQNLSFVLFCFVSNKQNKHYNLFIHFESIIFHWLYSFLIETIIIINITINIII